MTPLAGSADTVVLYDRPVARLGFGAMRVAGKPWGEPDDRVAALRLLRRVVELGIQLIDTADLYGEGVSERLIAEALYPYPPGVVIATKGGSVRTGPKEWRTDGRPEHLRAACEASLARLRLDRIDLYQLHAVDPNVPLEDSVGALADLRAEGLIRRIGLSNVTVDQIERARRIVPIATVQNRYSVIDRAGEAVVAYCEREDIAFLPWWPLGAGLLTAPASALPPMPDVQRRVRQRVHRLADELDATPAQVALAWLLARSPVILPIPGTSSVRHLEEIAAARRLELSAAQLASLDPGG